MIGLVKNSSKPPSLDLHVLDKAIPKRLLPDSTITSDSTSTTIMQEGDFTIFLSLE